MFTTANDTQERARETIGAHDARTYEDILNEATIGRAKGWERFGISPYALREMSIPSWIVRAEFLAGDPHRDDLVGLDYGASDVGYAQSLGIPVGLRLGHALRARGMHALNVYCGFDQDADAPLKDVLRKIEAAQIECRHVEHPRDVPSDGVTWIHGDIIREMERERMRQIPHLLSFIERAVIGPCVDARDDLIGFNAVRLSEVRSPEELSTRFPKGFIVRKLDPRARHVLRCGPEPTPDMRHQFDIWCNTFSEVRKIVFAENAGSFYAQPLRDGERVRIRSKTYREHRILFFVFDAREARYELVGGYATMRHGSESEPGAVLHAM